MWRLRKILHSKTTLSHHICSEVCIKKNISKNTNKKKILNTNTIKQPKQSEDHLVQLYHDIKLQSEWKRGRSCKYPGDYNFIFLVQSLLDPPPTSNLSRHTRRFQQQEMGLFPNGQVGTDLTFDPICEQLKNSDSMQSHKNTYGNSGPSFPQRVHGSLKLQVSAVPEVTCNENTSDIYIHTHIVVSKK